MTNDVMPVHDVTIVFGTLPLQTHCLHMLQIWLLSNELVKAILWSCAPKTGHAMQAAQSPCYLLSSEDAKAIQCRHAQQLGNAHASQCQLL